MTTPDLESLSTLTRDYAAFQSRKSGLATALGGLLAAVLVLAALSPYAMGARMMDRLLLEYLVWVPLLWLALKWMVGKALYHGLGTVKATPDGAYEHRRWLWIMGLALFLVAVLLAALYAFASGFLQANPSRATLHLPPMWVLMMPLLYLIPTPWTIHGIEEARVYAVLVGQCILWLVPTFLFNFGTPVRPMHSDWGLFGDLSGIGLVILVLTVLVWGALAMVRGWREHREYQSLLRSLPRES